jgi:cytochrome c oxidase subunit IV
MSEHHIVQPKTYITILLCLFVLMAATIGAAYIDLGSPIYNLIVALFIACCKMSLILMFFMHVKYGSKLTAVFATGGFFWLIIFFTLLFCDYVARYVSTSPFSPSPYGG